MTLSCEVMYENKRENWFAVPSITLLWLHEMEFYNTQAHNSLVVVFKIICLQMNAVFSCFFFFFFVSGSNFSSEWFQVGDVLLKKRKKV